MKTIEEWSDAFDTAILQGLRVNDAGLLDNYKCNEYEKSLFLTQAQEEVVKEYYKGTTIYFESTEDARRALDQVVLQESLIAVSAPQLKDRFIHTSFELPKNIWYIVHEQVKLGEDVGECNYGKNCDIVPILHDDYNRTIENPFRGPNKKRVLRLDSGEQIVELVSNFTIEDYVIRYIKEPEPIVLCDLTNDNLSINGFTQMNTCKLPSSLHNIILNAAVQLALSVKKQNQENNNKN